MANDLTMSLMSTSWAAVASKDAMAAMSSLLNRDAGSPVEGVGGRRALFDPFYLLVVQAKGIANPNSRPIFAGSL